ncbi:MAG: hypothetical protein ACFCVB_19240 [Nodosilinea sp.]
MTHRFGYTEECFFNYTFNPIQGEGGKVDGIFAVKFIPAAGRIEVQLIQSGANQARITVTDAGKGITPEFLPMITE